MNIFKNKKDIPRFDLNKGKGYKCVINERVAEILLFGLVGQEINGVYIADDIASINKWDLADKIHLRVNSEGGMIIDGVRIVSEMKKSKIPVSVFNDGFAVSMAATIFLAAKKENRFVADFALTMLHNPLIGGVSLNDIKDEKEKADLQKFKDQIIQLILDENEDVTQEWLSKAMDEETWLNADELAESNLMDSKNIISYKSSISLFKGGDIGEQVSKLTAMYTAPVINQNNNKMNYKELCRRAGLNEDASEQSLISAFDQKDSKIQSLTQSLKDTQEEVNKQSQIVTERDSEIVELKAKVKTYEDAEKAAKTKEVEALVDQAIKDGKYSKDQRETLITIAEKDVESFKTMANVKTEVKAPKLDLDGLGSGNDRKAMAAKYGIKPEEMTYDYLDRHNPDLIVKIKNEDPKFYDFLTSEYV